MQVFDEFIKTNKHQRRHYKFEEILDIREKTYFTFTHAEIPYLATVDFERGPRADWVIIRLVNDGFLYVAKRGQQRIKRHNRDDWVELSPEEGLDYCKAITSLTASRFPTARTLYTVLGQRTDFQFFPPDEKNVHLQIDFEPGYPFTEDTVPPRSYSSDASV